jgi:MFS family permease
MRVESYRPLPEPRDRWIALILLGLVYAINIADRLLMSILTEPIKVDLHLSDSEVGFLTATIFAVFYVGASVPFGILADKADRRLILAGTAALFSSMTALTGAARGYGMLLLARVGVGIGEAGWSPVALSFLLDKFAVHRRAGVISLYLLGGSLGAWVGASGASYLQGKLDWRGVLYVFGAAGFGLTILLLLFTREPPRGALEEAPSVAQPAKSSFFDALALCVSRRSILHTLIGGNVLSFWGWGIIWWGPAYLTRSFAVPMNQAGALFGPIHGIVGASVVLFSAALMFALAKRDSRVPFWFLAVGAAIATVPTLGIVFGRSVGMVITMYWLFMPMAYVYTGINLATIAAATPAHFRGQTAAIYMATSNFTGLAIAPQFVGLVSDLLAPHLTNPAESLRYALLPLALTGCWGAAHFWIASRSVRHDLDRVSSPTLGVPSPA